MSSVVFTNISVLDGTGKAPFTGHVRVQGNRIQEVLPIEAPLPDGRDGDADGWAPGTNATAAPTIASIA
jgi:hypothetical protein